MKLLFEAGLGLALLQMGRPVAHARLHDSLRSGSATLFRDLQTCDGNYLGQTLDTGCMNELAGRKHGCTAGDVKIASATVSPDSPDSCVQGEDITFTAEFQIVTTATERYDIGLFFSSDGDPDGTGARSGECAVSTLPTYDIPGTASGVLNNDLSATPCDQCGDTSSSSEVLYNLTLTVACEPGAGGKLALPYCTSWRVSGNNNLCTSPADAFPGTTSKCKCDDGFVIDIDVNVGLLSTPTCDGGLNGYTFTAASGFNPLVSCTWTFTLSDGSTVTTPETGCTDYDPEQDLVAAVKSRPFTITDVSVNAVDSTGNTGTQSLTGETLSYYEELIATASLQEQCDAFSYSASYTGGSGSVTYAWAFSTGDMSTTQSGTLAIPGDGTYSGTVTITDSETQCSDTDTDTVVVQGPVASFTTSENSCSPVVAFDASSSGSGAQAITGYSWSFGDGSTGTGATTSHTYDPLGGCAYDVTLTVTDAIGCMADSSVTTVNIGDTPVASFTASVPQCSPEVAFTSTSTNSCNGPLTYEWDFGPEGSSTASDPSFTFSSCGDKEVTLAVTDGNQCVHSSTQTVSGVNKKPTASLGTLGIDDCDLSLDVDGTASDDGCGSTPSNYMWDFGDSVTAVGGTYTHTYSTCGEYTVTLTVEDDKGCESDAVSGTIYANKGPTAALSIEQNCFDASFDTQVTDCDTSVDPNIYTESLVCEIDYDGSGLNPITCGTMGSFTYSCGTYPVNFKVRDAKGCTDTVGQSVSFEVSFSSSPL